MPAILRKHKIFTAPFAENRRINVRILNELPKTPTAKVMKAELRKDGITPDTWDREAAGIKLKRERL
jgi:acyl-coenzyme A synthetase/AMP-(fatty) acid ligase